MLWIGTEIPKRIWLGGKELSAVFLRGRKVWERKPTLPYLEVTPLQLWIMDEQADTQVLSNVDWQAEINDIS